MTKALLIQLPIPPLAFGIKTANVPLAGACMKLAAEAVSGTAVDILPERVASYLGDAALEEEILARKPDIVGFSIFNWNLLRSLDLARKLKGSGISVIFGGPEITPDNPLIDDTAVDLFVFGEGETVFPDLLGDFPKWPDRKITAPPYPGFPSRPSPYLSGFLDPEIDDLMYLETQRGCIYHCGFCFYNKSRGKTAAAEGDRVIDGIRWALEHRIRDVCIIDPSFDSRAGLKSLLDRIAILNADHTLSLNAEIRAETVTPELADRFAAAGFAFFEIGLQSTNPAALAAMRRKTDLKRFLDGTHLLKERNIIPRIDLIVGLPGDDPEGFRKSLAFIAENDLSGDIQVFPLSVLPGTDFRCRSRELGLDFSPFPPYTILKTQAFSANDIYDAFDHAETLCDVSLFPPPGLDVAFSGNKTAEGDIPVRLNGGNYIRKVVLDRYRGTEDIDAVSKRLTFPYQVIVDRKVNDPGYLCGVVHRLSKANPHTPFEVVFLEPPEDPDLSRLLSSINLKRPHYLDIYNLYQYERPGNRSVLFTLVSTRRDLFFSGEMQRQVHWWTSPPLPEPEDLVKMADFDGVLIDVGLPPAALYAWQDRMAPGHEELPYISFQETGLQDRWIRLTAPESIPRFLR